MISYYVHDAAGSILAVYDDSVLKELPVYGAGRLGVAYRTGSNLTYTYELSDHLGNVRAVIQKQNNSASVSSATDYYPYGWNMPDRVSIGSERYRFGYQGQFAEKDDETGYNQFEARLWDSRIGRWLTTDPAGQYYSSYLGMGNDPVNGVDPDGMAPTDFINNKTGEHIYINDGINQVVNVSNDDWFLVKLFSGLNNVWYSNLSTSIYSSLLSRAEIRTDLKFTIPNVLAGKKWISIGNMECGAAARKQNKHHNLIF